MKNSLFDDGFFLLFLAMVPWSAFSYYIFHFQKNVVVKRKFYLIINLAPLAVLCFSVLFFSQLPLAIELALCAGFVFITYKNMKGTRFCDVCSRTNIDFHSPPLICVQCGAPLTKEQEKP